MPSEFKVVRSIQCDLDPSLIFDHLFNAYREFGDDPEPALERAAKRIRDMEDRLFALGDMPMQGIPEPRLMAGLRHVTKDKAVFYFIVDEEQRVVRVLGVFFGGQDHRRRILERIAGS